MTIVVVGYGMAGARLVAELRARDTTADITVLGAETHRAYNRILLSSVLAGKVDPADISLAAGPADQVDVRLGEEATSIDAARRVVTTRSGGEYPYDHLVLAMGSRAVVPPVPGLDPDDLPERVAVFRTLDDCRRILKAAAQARTALVLGGGLLGLEAARGLAGRGLAVTVVHPAGHLMERQLDPVAGDVLARTLTDLGITAHLNIGAAAVDVTDDGVAMTLTDGRRVHADLLVMACGVRAESDLAATAGLPVGRGILVDDRLRTADEHISAIGDCAEFPGGFAGLVAPAWDQARVVADLLSGADPRARYRPAPPVTRLKAAGIDLAAMGETADAADSVSYVDPGRGLYAKLVIRENRLAGAILLGEHDCVGTIIQHFDRQTPLPADCRPLLLGRLTSSGGTGTAHSPALMPDQAVVCRCNNVTKGAITKAWLGGSRNIAASTQATTGCGTCRDAVDGIIGWLSAQDTPAAGEVVPA